jgi:hypothetical protein
MEERRRGISKEHSCCIHLTYGVGDEGGVAFCGTSVLVRCWTPRVLELCLHGLGCRAYHQEVGRERVCPSPPVFSLRTSVGGGSKET